MLDSPVAKWLENYMSHRVLPAAMSLILILHLAPAGIAAGSPDVNFKIYTPGSGTSDGVSDAVPESNAEEGAGVSTAPSAAASEPAPAATDSTPAPSATEAAPAAAPSETSTTTAAPEASTSAEPAAPAEAATAGDDTKGKGDGEKIASKVLQGYIRVVPSGTRVPIIMDTAIDSDTSQEGDEFSARTSEDLDIDGSTVVPAGSIIKGRIAQLNAPRRLDRSGSVALKFDTVTTPDNRQIPLVANLVAHGGVVHARRGLKDVAMDTGVVALPILAGLGIGLLAGHSSNGTSSSTTVSNGTVTRSKSSGVSRAEGAAIGAAIGAAVGIVILLSKKGKKIDVRPGDEMKIELAEDLRMPM